MCPMWALPDVNGQAAKMYAGLSPSLRGGVRNACASRHASCHRASIAVGE